MTDGELEKRDGDYVLQGDMLAKYNTTSKVGANSKTNYGGSPFKNSMKKYYKQVFADAKTTSTADAAYVKQMSVQVDELIAERDQMREKMKKMRDDFARVREENGILRTQVDELQTVNTRSNGSVADIVAGALIKAGPLRRELMRVEESDEAPVEPEEDNIPKIPDNPEILDISPDISRSNTSDSEDLYQPVK